MGMPKIVTIPARKEEVQKDKKNNSTTIGLETESKKKEKDKEKEKEKKKTANDPFLSLSAFIRFLNLDTYNERILTGGKVLSHEYFTSTVFSRLKRVTISGIDKPLRSLTLQDDNVQFFYAPYIGSIQKNTMGIHHTLLSWQAVMIRNLHNLLMWVYWLHPGLLHSIKAN